MLLAVDTKALKAHFGISMCRLLILKYDTLISYHIMIGRGFQVDVEGNYPMPIKLQRHNLVKTDISKHGGDWVHHSK